MDRISTFAGTLARKGFSDPERAAAVLRDWMGSQRLGIDAVGAQTEPGILAHCGTLVAEILDCADPDAALDGIDRLVAVRPGFLQELTGNQSWIRRLVRVLGASVALSQHLVGHPEDAELLRNSTVRRTAAELRISLLAAVGADPGQAAPVAEAGRSDDLRLAYRREVLRIAARDLTAADPTQILPEVAAELADLADATVETALALARDAVPDWASTRLGVVALGKCGAQELNYVSDVDVLFVAEPAADERGGPKVASGVAMSIATRLATTMTRICSAHTSAGTIWKIDAALRPEGNAGPLVRTVASHTAYYDKWAKNWEFQAMLKARAMAGDLALAQDFVDMVQPRVWRVGEQQHFVAETRAMRKRVVSLIPKPEAGREIKLGQGGLRDVEFSVQLLQLVHGRVDDRLRLRGTLPALQALVDHGYVGRRDGAALAEAYRLQRLLEHRIQLRNLRRSHLMPADEAGLRRLARASGLPNADQLTRVWRASTRTVTQLHQRLFYSPVLEAVARIPTEEVHLTSEAAETRLFALGYGDPVAALRHIRTLSQGMSRQAEIQRQLLPAMLGWFAEGPNPDYGLLAFRQVSEALGSTHWYLRALRDEGAMAEMFAKVLASSRYVVDLMLRAPQTVTMLTDRDELLPRTYEQILHEMRVSARRHRDQEEAIAIVRAIRRKELLRVAMGELLELINTEEVGVALTDLTSAVIDAALEVASREMPGMPEVAVIAMGRWGGCEMSYGSDADAIFVVADSEDPEAVRRAIPVLARVRALLGSAGPDPALEIDIDLRPEGKGGPIARTLSSCLAYYRRWSSTWEAQALLRASVGAGDRQLGAEFLAAVAGIRYPGQGLTQTQVTEIRKLKARMEVERLPRGQQPSRNTKLGPGGLSDVEWTIQLLQLRHAGAHAGLRTTMTLTAIAAARDAGLLDADDARMLTQAWTMSAQLRNLIMLSRGRVSDVIPNDSREIGALATMLGYDKGQGSLMIDEFRRKTRLARQVMDRLFWSNDVIRAD